MYQEEKQESAPPLPVLARLDRLDRLVQYLEEKHSTSCDIIIREVELEDQCKTLSSALEEVHQKGTLMDRLGMLENRVFQLSLDINGGNTSRSSSSTIDLTGKSRLGSDSTTLTSQDEDKQGLRLQTCQDNCDLELRLWGFFRRADLQKHARESNKKAVMAQEVSNNGWDGVGWVADDIISVILFAIYGVVSI